MGYFAPRPSSSRYSPSRHVICGLLCLFQEDACGCHVRDSKRESERVEIKKTTGLAQKRVTETGGHVGNGGKGTESSASG